MTTIMISDLRERPDFAGTVADRVWRAFWKKDGYPLEHLTGLVAQNLEGKGPVPSAFVAHEGDVFLGTSSLIACDEDSRPQYAPWVAAVWVEEEHRRKGIGAALVARTAEVAFASGARRVYLLARAHRRAFYEGLGWAVHEENVPHEGMFILVKDA
ncbi:GNAT family N-acetyltransferase [Microvirga flavescens]|uniref:GNAT family N-acetyltransferase n=1 Tax=Microvirga flavescens TaxID=2249811 RepID=UPI000DD7609E|nr:GNAT family N-acetyltransferase [Microvirga flavescens]